MNNSNERRLRSMEITPAEMMPVTIVYLYHEFDGEKGKSSAKDTAMATWEAENSPLEGREVEFFGVCFVSAKPPTDEVAA